MNDCPLFHKCFFVNDIARPAESLAALLRSAAPRARAQFPGEQERAGRWWWEQEDALRILVPIQVRYVQNALNQRGTAPKDGSKPVSRNVATVFPSTTPNAKRGILAKLLRKWHASDILTRKILYTFAFAEGGE
jgi:hypothetical protein